MWAERVKTVSLDSCRVGDGGTLLTASSDSSAAKAARIYGAEVTSTQVSEKGGGGIGGQR